QETEAQRVRLTITQNVFDDSRPSPARGAVVRVVSDGGTTTPFAERADSAGVYGAIGMRLERGSRLTLRITWQGDEYESSETVRPAVAMDSLFFLPDTRSSTPAGLRATLAARDPAGTRNFYLWEQWVDGRRIIQPDSETFARVVASDELFDGGRVRSFQPYAVTVDSGQLVRMRQLSISEQAYRFYQMLSEQTTNSGSPFGVPAGNVRGNIANLTRPERLGLGYFIVAEYSELERRVP
ncbi:MAG TPA: DUF4249 domain-containing protein, partial [Gemmatimonas sp.]|nr:DUF4249 domain-containing protein [Gemmatimonas sp.]